MPLFEVKEAGTLLPFRQLLGGAELYESEIEDLLWSNLEEFTGEALFRVRRQPTLVGGGRPDIVGLDRQGAVVVIEVKRDVDRGQLAQCLEYAGWARTTNLNELAGLYHAGSDMFWADWQDFTESSVPVRVLRSPRLILVARDFHGRTGSAFEFLVENNLPVRLIRVSLYEDAQKRRFVDVEGEHEPSIPSTGITGGGTAIPTTIDGRRVRLTDLLDAGLVPAGTPLIWERRRLGQEFRATFTDNGSIKLDDGRSFSSPSGAAMAAAGIPSYDGWYAWRVDSPDGKLLHDLRMDLLHQFMGGAEPAADADGRGTSDEDVHESERVFRYTASPE